MLWGQIRFAGARRQSGLETARMGLFILMVATAVTISCRNRASRGGNGVEEHRTEITSDLGGVPGARSSRPLNFERAEVLTLEGDPPRYLLDVSGTKPHLNMEVELVPLTYISQPEYWGIEVVGSLHGAGLPTPGRYTASLPLAGFIGSQGIEVIGADRSGTIEVPPIAEQLGVCHDWTALHDHQPPGPPVLWVSGRCRFPTAGYSVELRPHEPQGISADDLLLDRIVHAPTGAAAQIVTETEVSYREETDFDYKTVTILPDGPSIKIEDVY
jgi:hypothetical protein